MSAPALERAKTLLGSRIVDSHAHRGDETIVIDGPEVVHAIRKLKEDPELALDFLVDLTVVDYLGRDARFEVVYHFRSMKHGHRLRVKARVVEPEDGSPPEIESLVPLWVGANWLEREAWDLYGIKFRGHPDLRRILMYEEFVGHPLRKDYPKDRRQPLVRREIDPIFTAAAEAGIALPDTTGPKS